MNAHHPGHGMSSPINEHIHHVHLVDCYARRFERLAVLIECLGHNVIGDDGDAKRIESATAFLMDEMAEASTEIEKVERSAP